MASKTTLNAENLAALGAEALAVLLIEISTGDANAKRRLRLELAGRESPDKLVHEIRKRLTAIAAASTFIGWRGVKAFISDLQTQRRLIAGHVAAWSPSEALDLMWTFLTLGNAVLERTTDTSGTVIAIFREAGDDLGRLAALAAPDADDLAAGTAAIMAGNGYGQYDDVVAALVPVLGTTGLDRLKDLLTADTSVHEARTRSGTRKTAKWARGRKLEKDLIRRRTRAQAVHCALQDIADAQGDIDAYIALQSQPRAPDTALDIAARLRSAGRAADSLTVLDTIAWRPGSDKPAEWDMARIAVLQDLGREADAQAARLALFHRTLDPDALRAYVRRLPDFDDIEAEDAALDAAQAFGDVHAALAFLIAWPAPDRAAALVLARAAQIDGGRTDLLTAAADRLMAKYSLAATVLLRKMIEVALRSGRDKVLVQAGHQLAECAGLARRIDHFGDVPSHDTYVERLRAAYRGKTEFWQAAG